MKSILFTKEMVLAILNGKKTQTRRLIKSLDIPRSGFIDYSSGEYTFITPKNHITLQLLPDMESEYLDYHIPLKYLPNEIIYVKEPFFVDKEEGILLLKYENNSIEFTDCPWKSPLFMPEEYSRIKLEIKDIFIQQVQDISEDDCIKEGIRREPFLNSYTYVVKIGDKWKRDKDPKECFRLLWESIHGKDNGKCWDSNPWVFVYDFKVVEVKE